MDPDHRDLLPSAASASLAATSLAELHRRRDVAEHVGGERAVAAARRRGLLTAPERVALLLDPGTDVPFGRLTHADDPRRADETFGDGELCGFGRVDGRWISYFASDPRVKGASGGPAGRRHSQAFRNLVERSALPLFFVMQGGGARIDEAMTSAFISFPGTGMGARKVFERRGVLLTIVLGAYYAPWNVAQADFSVMTEASNISLTSPPLVRVGTGQEVTPEELGGAELQATITGQIDAVVADEQEAIAMARRAFSYLPSHARTEPPMIDVGDPPNRMCPELRDIVPTLLNRAYDVRDVIRVVTDRDSFLEYSPRFARNLVTGLARIDGRTVVVMANQPSVMAGVLDVGAVIKAHKALTLCVELGLPLVSLVDVPGVLPTKEQEQRRIMTSLYEHGVLRLRARVPKVAVVLRKGVGFGVMAMTAGDPEAITFVWPGAQICFTGVEAAVRVVHRAELDAAADPEALLRQLQQRYEGGSAPWIGAHLGHIDDVIDPAETRARVARALDIGRSRGR